MGCEMVPIQQQFVIGVAGVVVSPRQINDASSVVAIRRKNDKKMKNIVATTKKIERPGLPAFWDSFGVQNSSTNVTERHRHLPRESFHHRRRNNLPNE